MLFGRDDDESVGDASLLSTVNSYHIKFYANDFDTYIHIYVPVIYPHYLYRIRFPYLMRFFVEQNQKGRW